MDKLWRHGHYFVNQMITGPQCLLLMLDLQSERINDPFVSAIEVCPIYGQPTDEVVRAAVLAGSDRANSEFGTSYHPLEIRYSYSGWNNEKCYIMGWASYNIVTALAKLGVAGIEQIHSEHGAVDKRCGKSCCASHSAPPAATRPRQ